MPANSGRSPRTSKCKVDRSSSRCSETAILVPLEVENQRAVDPRLSGQCQIPSRQTGQAWLVRPECRIKLHFIPAYCPHLNPIERLWGLMHRHTTHNKCYSSFKDFSIAMLNFLRDDVPRNWRTYCDEVTDNFRIIDP